MIAALFAFAAALVVTGWLALRHSPRSRRSRRAARLWAALALTALAGACVIQIVQAAGPWWPLRLWPWELAEVLAVLVWFAALALAWRARGRGWHAGQLLLACGVAIFCCGLIAGALGPSASERSKVCPGAPAKLGRWTASLRAVQPVVGADHTGVEARLALGFSDGAVLEARPQRRDYPAGSSGPMAGSQTLVRWNGELMVESVPHRHAPECAELIIAWQPFAPWLRYGAWASFAGALVLLAGALRSAAWRASSGQRVAMRREDMGRGPLPAGAAGQGWKPLVLALACGVIAFAWAAARQPVQDPPRRGATDGAALIAARQAQFAGPHLGNRWLIVADALARHGQFGEAAQVLLGATASEPGNAEAWLALGDALYGHAGGRLVPAAELAYVRADRTAAPQASARSVAAQAMAASGRASDAEQWLCRDYLPHRQCPD